MNEIIIRATDGLTIIGRIRDTPDRIEARKANGVLIGWYDKTSEFTRYANGKTICRGNAVSLLLSEC